MRSCSVARDGNPAVWPGSSGMARRLIEGIDYTLDEQGRRVFTASYLMSLDYCCGLDCRNCPYRAKALETQEKPEAA